MGKVTTYLVSLVQLCCGEGGTLQTSTAGMHGECLQWMDHTGFATAQGSTLLSLQCSLQGHTPRWAVLFVPFPGLSSSGDWVLGELTVPDGPCILMTSPVWDAISQVCCESTVLGVHVSPLGG